MTRSLDPVLLDKHDRPAPDYGIFPGLVRFPEKLTVADYRLAAHGSNEDPIPKPLTVHVHVPAGLGHEADGATRYLACLKREMAIQGSLFDDDRRIERLVLAGGGVRRLDDDQLAGLLTELHRHFGLKRSRDRVFALRIGPDGLSPQRLTDLIALGFNRLAIDMRGAGASAVDRLLEIKSTARPAYLYPPTVELGLRLPGRTSAGFSALLEGLVCLRPERISLSREAGRCTVAWPGFPGASAAGDQSGTPMRHATLGLLAQGVERLAREGYEHAGTGRFLLANDSSISACRDELEHETDCIGLGAGAISHVADGYYQNARELSDYHARLDAGELAVCRGYELNADDRVRNDVIQHLMARGSVRYATIEKRHRIVFRNYFAPELQALQEMAGDGLVDIRRDGMALTPSGRLLTNRLAMIFDGAFGDPRPRYLQMI
ncbi:oxygen-independent coproporphyrinogen III oxidase [Modicisalibacter radicis]|uniref:hypothetical protein n=1 Tax=Halomonas sp. EAR18 TaxID=2518972 RepID=UPI00109BFF96|nr:hypothetical protein [Halomonas sp. EAR18]